MENNNYIDVARQMLSAKDGVFYMGILAIVWLETTHIITKSKYEMSIGSITVRPTMEE